MKKSTKNTPLLRLQLGQWEIRRSDTFPEVTFAEVTNSAKWHIRRSDIRRSDLRQSDIRRSHIRQSDTLPIISRHLQGY